ncbi:hypothetical protein [Acinetobacter chinensis]|uniref:hypothetical protein n=1 Tax=Acinetobacter chinensis TaxID=2004650 RepID=UPI002934A791|nr:hypothetical protein [Acinetobacter chinensis]WOE40503.1 hypothetical protein QSG87_11410 [Acinetobacter chinensis]
MFKKIILNDPLKIIWISTLSIGFVILVFFFTQIEFLPTFDLQAILSVFTTVTIFCIFCIVILTLMNILPSLTWFEIFIGNPENSYFFKNNKNKNIILYFGLPLILSISSLTIIVFKDAFNQWILLIPIFIYIIMLSEFYITLKLSNIFNEEVKAESELLKLFLANTVSSFCMIFPIYFLLLLTSQSKESDSWIGLFIFSVFVIFLIFINIINITISNEFNNFKRIIFSILFGFIILFYTLIAFQKFDIITNKTFEIYKLGNFEVEKIILNKDGCEIFKAYEIPITTFGDKCTAIDGKIISRIGTESYLEFKDKKFPLSSNYVLSWIPKTKVKNEKNYN